MEEDAMQLPKFRLDGTLTLGNVLQIAVIIGGFVLYYGATVEWKTGVDSWRTEVQDKLIKAEASRNTNLPRLNQLEASDRIQDERIAGVNRGLDNIQTTLAETNKALTEIGKTVAVIEERTKKPN